MRFTKRDRDSYVQLLIAFAQVTFGIFWASLFLPIEQIKFFVIVSNLAVTMAIIVVIGLLNKK